MHLFDVQHDHNMFNMCLIVFCLVENCRMQQLALDKAVNGCKTMVHWKNSGILEPRTQNSGNMQRVFKYKVISQYY